MIKLSRNDKKLLIVLSRNCRLSQNELSKLTGFSRDSVNYRIKKLEKDGIIKKYVCHFSNQKLGVDNFVVFVKLSNIDSFKEKRLIEKLSTIENIKILFKTRGEYDLLIVVGSKNKIHLSQIINRISNICSRELSEMDLGIYIKILKNEKYDFLLDDFDYSPERKRINFDYEIDLTDYKIMKILSNDAKLSTVEISKILDLSVQTISKRIKLLFNNGMITNSQAVIDINKLGFQVYFLCLKFNYYSYKKELMIKQILEKMKNVTYAERLLGKWDLRLNVTCLSHEEFLKILDNFRSIFKKDLKNYSFSIILNEELRRTMI